MSSTPATSKSAAEFLAEEPKARKAAPAKRATKATATPAKPATPAKVERPAAVKRTPTRPAKAATATTPAKPATPAKRTTTRPSAAAKAVTKAIGVKVVETPPAKPATPAKRATAKATKPVVADDATARFADRLAYAKADLDAAHASGKPVHPGLVWRVLMFGKNMSQLQTAAVMGIADQGLNRLFNGKGLPTVNMTIKFANAIGEDAAAMWLQVATYEYETAIANA